MVLTKGSRFGVISGHTVRRTKFSYSQLCANQHIVIQSNQSFRRGSQETKDVHLSMNKKNRWQMSDDLVNEVNVPECTVFVSQHHLKPGRYRKSSDCLQVCSKKRGERRWSDVNRASSRVEDLSDLMKEEVDDDEMRQTPAKMRRKGRGRKGCKKRQNQEENIQEEEVLVLCKTYTAPLKHHFQTQEPKGQYSGKLSKARKGLPGGNASYFQGMYDDEVWDEYEDIMMKEAVEDSLDDLRSTEIGYTKTDGSLGDFITHSKRVSPKKKTKKGYKAKNDSRITRSPEEEKSDHIFYVDEDEHTVYRSCQSESHIPKSRGWKDSDRTSNKDEKAGKQKGKRWTATWEHTSFIVSVHYDDVKDLKVAASMYFDCPTFLWGKCLPPCLVVNITPYIHDKLRQEGFFDTIKEMKEIKRECWILVEKNDKEPQQDTQLPHQGTDKGNKNMRLTLIGLPRSIKREKQTRAYLNDLHFGKIEDMMNILKEHVDHLPLTGLSSASIPTAEPEVKVNVLGEVWEWTQKTKTPSQLMNQLEVVDSCHGDTDLEDCFLKPNGDTVTECGICLERDVSGPDGVTVGATALTDCQHWFCNNCWRNYLKAEINRGETRLTCPAFDCKTSVDDITVASLVPASYQQFKEQQREVLGISQQLIVCPRNACDHFLPMAPEVSGATKSSPGLLCACGHVFCSRCRKRLHWPSTCEQNEMYKEDFPKKVEYFKKCTIRHVNFRRCPACSRPLEKYTGCNFVTCRCSYSFCWVCGVTLKSHYHPRVCKPSNLEIVFADVIRLSSNFDRAIIHHKKGSKVAADARRIQANKLMSKMIPVIRGSPWLPCSQPTPQTKRSNTLVLDRTVSVQFLSQVFGDAVDICNETEFVLENLEIFLSSRSILDQSKRKLVTEIKGRLGYTSNQIQKILEEKSHSDLLAIPERLLNLARLGRQNLHKLAITLK